MLVCRASEKEKKEWCVSTTHNPNISDMIAIFSPQILKFGIWYIARSRLSTKVSNSAIRTCISSRSVVTKAIPCNVIKDKQAPLMRCSTTAASLSRKRKLRRLFSLKCCKITTKATSRRVILGFICRTCPSGPERPFMILSKAAALRLAATASVIALGTSCKLMSADNIHTTTTVFWLGKVMRVAVAGTGIAI